MISPDSFESFYDAAGMRLNEARDRTNRRTKYWQLSTHPSHQTVNYAAMTLVESIFDLMQGDESRIIQVRIAIEHPDVKEPKPFPSEVDAAHVIVSSRRSASAASVKINRLGAIPLTGDAMDATLLGVSLQDKVTLDGEADTLALDDTWLTSLTMRVMSYGILPTHISSHPSTY